MAASVKGLDAAGVKGLCFLVSMMNIIVTQQPPTGGGEDVGTKIPARMDRRKRCHLVCDPLHTGSNTKPNAWLQFQQKHDTSASQRSQPARLRGGIELLREVGGMSTITSCMKHSFWE